MMSNAGAMELRSSSSRSPSPKYTSSYSKNQPHAYGSQAFMFFSPYVTLTQFIFSALHSSLRPLSTVNYKWLYLKHYLKSIIFSTYNLTQNIMKSIVSINKNNILKLKGGWRLFLRGPFGTDFKIYQCTSGLHNKTEQNRKAQGLQDPLVFSRQSSTLDSEADLKNSSRTVRLRTLIKHSTRFSWYFENLCVHEALTQVDRAVQMRPQLCKVTRKANLPWPLNQNTKMAKRKSLKQLVYVGVFKKIPLYSRIYDSND